MMPARASGAVRAELAQHTRADHEALHRHPWLSRLTQPGLCLPVYAAVLRAYSALYCAIEAQRRAMSAYPILSLAPLCRSLAADLDALPQFQGACLCRLPVLRDASEVLGALYVLHGARFGARSLRAGVARALPGATRHFLDADMPPGLWRDLVRALEAKGADVELQASLLTGARSTFQAVGATVSAACEAGLDPRHPRIGQRPQMQPLPNPSPARSVAPPPGVCA